ncbi:uncharacterized protein [Glycine max]|uniref:uncharacterized protein n=1 Tax=Glycine max TaxID=3847 RepID=UPI0003DE7D54|nr:uncharacterized protein LOC102665241 [Glycine max]|eukprot:XP_006579196.1 uncharacterized protein LOC102665241 [Glycine max]
MDPVKYIFEKPTLTRRIARWQVLLSEFDIVYVTQKALKGSALEDYLAQQPISDFQPMHPDFPDEDIMEESEDEDKEKWIVWFDEYKACALGIRATIDFRVKLLKVYGDSTLVIHQLKCEWETKDRKLIPYQAYIKELMELFDDISFHHIPREENQMAYALATLSSVFKINPHRDLPCIDIKCHVKPAHYCLIEEEEDGKPWYFDIKRYIKDKEYPAEASDNDKRTLQRLATSFLLSGDVLNKRNHDMVLLRCVNIDEAE